MKTMRSIAIVTLWLYIPCLLLAQPGGKKRVLAVGVSMGWEHESVSDALGTIYDLGKETGLWETWIRTDTRAITKKDLLMNAKNLNYFDAVFFMTTGELPLDDQQKADLLSFVRDDGKGFLGAHNATDTFYKWPEYGDMIGGWFDGHPWNQFMATVIVEDRAFPAMRHFPQTFQIYDEIYQTKDFSRDRVRVLMKLDTSKADMSAKGVKYQEIPLAWKRAGFLVRPGSSACSLGARGYPPDVDRSGEMGDRPYKGGCHSTACTMGRGRKDPPPFRRIGNQPSGSGYSWAAGGR
jgi:type 1 glutamine amidotransferase